MPKKNIAIHQPNYLPWLGYFYKIYLSDIFVFHDNVTYTKQSLTKRTWIRQAKKTVEKSYLVVPLIRSSDTTLIKDLEIDHTQNWQKRQLNQIHNTYSNSPYFSWFYTYFQEWMEASTQFTRLSDWNQFLIKKISYILKLETDFDCSSDLPTQGAKSDYNLKIAQYFDADVYWSGQGGKKYQVEDDFLTEGIHLQYHSFHTYIQQHPYPQYQGPSLMGLSVIDALTNIGRKATFQLLDSVFRQCDS